MVDRGPDGKFVKGNHGNFRHGGESAIKDLQHGRPLRNVVAELAKDVALELHENGAIEFLWQRAIDHAAVARLYLGLILAEDDAVTLDNWVKRFGWLNDKCFRMVRDLLQLEQMGGDDVVDYEVILAEKAKQDAQSTD